MYLFLSIFSDSDYSWNFPVPTNISVQLIPNRIKLSSIIHLNISSDAKQMYTHLHSIVYNNLFLLIILIMVSIFYRNSFDMKLIKEGYRVRFEIEMQKIEFQCDLLCVVKWIALFIDLCAQ